MKKYSYLLCLCFLGFAQLSAGQRPLDAIALPGSTAEWLKVRGEVALDASNFFPRAGTALGLKETDSFVLQKTETDRLGMVHHRFQQYAHGIRVHGAEYALHESNGRIVKANGKLASGLQAPAPGYYQASYAREQALSAVPSNRYWQEEGSVPDPGELVWVRKDYSGDFTPENLRLAWKFDIYTNDGHSSRVFVDAWSGEILHRIPLAMSCHPGQGLTTWNGEVDIWTETVDFESVLWDNCQDAHITVWNANGNSTPDGAEHFTDADNIWDDQPAAVQTFFGARQTFRYFLEEHSRNSFDDDEAHIELFNNVFFPDIGGNNNACWNCFPGRLTFGAGDTGLPTDDWNTLDIVGHEYTHAVTQYSAGLEYQGESGALNESFSDIFGEMVEWFTEGTVDWMVGGDRGVVRNFSFPGTFFQPDTYLGNFWADTANPDDTNDYGGVHTNSGVQNHWFFLLSQGGTVVNDNGDNFTVEGIGIEKAAQIAYRNLTVYLGANSNYDDAKNGAIQAAEDLFGSCSNETLQCARAWNAVGVNTSDDLGYDVSVNCFWLQVNHLLGIPVTVTAQNSIFSDCFMEPNGAPVVFRAGHSVVLKPGFNSGNNFHAFIQPCTSSLQASSAGNQTALPNPQAEAAANPPIRQTTKLEVSPNPFFNHFQVSFNLPATAQVSLSLADTFGREVLTLAQSRELDAGEHAFEVDVATLPPGLYFLKMETESVRILEKIVKAAE